MMHSCRITRILWLAALLFVFHGIGCARSLAQEPPFAASELSISASSVINVTTPELSRTHKFWDTRNLVLFSGNAALSTADFVVTRGNIQNGGRELNPVVRLFGRSTPGLAVNFAGQTACVVAVSYIFHKTSHHKLERWVSLANMGASAGAVTFGLTHR